MAAYCAVASLAPANQLPRLSEWVRFNIPPDTVSGHFGDGLCRQNCTYT